MARVLTLVQALIVAAGRTLLVLTDLLKVDLLLQHPHLNVLIPGPSLLLQCEQIEQHGARLW